jgi:tetratricopeptide (TPR) repeat protein
MSTNSDYPIPPAPSFDGAEAPPAPSSIPAPTPPGLEGSITEPGSSDQLFTGDLPPDAASIPEPPAIPAAPPPPTPGIAGALGWCLLLSIYAGLATAPGYLLLKLVLPDKSTPVLLFVSSSIATCFVALALVKKSFGSQRRRRLAVRRVSLFHLVLVVLMVPPLFLVVAETVNCAAQILDPERQQVSAGEHAARRAEARLARTSAFSDWTEKMYREMAAQPWWLILLAGCLLPAVGEEAFCRGFLGRGLVARYGLVVGILVTSVLFGLLHVDPVQICATTVAGVGLHIVYLTTRTYWAPVMLHALHNSLVFVAIRLGEDAQFDITGQYEDGHLSPLSIAAAGAALLALLLLLYRTRTRWVLEDGQDWSPGYVSAEMPPAELAATARLGSPGQVSLWTAGIVYLTFAMVALVLADPDTPHTAWSYNERGNKRLDRGEFDAAIADCTDALRLDPNYAWAYGNRGLGLIKKKRYAEAIPDLDQAIRLEPTLADAYLNRGLARQQLGQYDSAIADYARVLRLKPDDVLAQYNRGLVYYLKGEDDQAIADFTAVLQREPANADACFRRGHAYLTKNRWEEAIRDFTTAIRLEPKNAGAYYLRGIALESTGDKAGAEADRREAERIDPDIAEKFK